MKSDQIRKNKTVFRNKIQLILTILRKTEDKKTLSYSPISGQIVILGLKVKFNFYFIFSHYYSIFTFFVDKTVSIY